MRGLVGVKANSALGGTNDSNSQRVERNGYFPLYGTDKVVFGMLCLLRAPQGNRSLNKLQKPSGGPLDR